MSKLAILRACEIFESNISGERLENPTDPVDDLIFILLSNRASLRLAKKVFDKAVHRFENWTEVVEAPSELEEIVRPLGLHKKRVAAILGCISKLIEDFGEPTLSSLSTWTAIEAQTYLCSLPGVSQKVARCVMMYCLGFDVLPVDTHVHTVSRRLGVEVRSRPASSHEVIEQVVPPGKSLTFHVGCIIVGQNYCLKRKPLCSACMLSEICPSNVA